MGYDYTVFKGSPDGSIRKTTTHRPDLSGDQVLVKVTHSGVCFTDVHYRQADMGLGHEGAGVVDEVGPNVRALKKGDRVGWGYEHNSCEHCKHCLTGWETMCAERQMYASANKDQGSFASHGIWREAFLFRVPEGVSNEDSGPLMCGGATVFSALHVAGVKSTSRVGIVGIGGLGHLAIQFAAKMGCQVVVFSGTDSKKEEAKKLGAAEFYATKGLKELNIGKPIDNLIVTTSAQPDWALYLPILDAGATISPLSVSMDDFKISYMGLLSKGLRVQGSLVAARKVHNDMLEFAAFHGIKPINVVFPMTEDGIKDCLNTLEEGKMRYRGVLVAQ